MKIRKDAYNWLIRLEREETLISSLNAALVDQNIHSGWVMGIGACEWVELGFYDLKTKEYRWKKFSSPMEILSLKGNVSIKEGKPFLHLHGSFSDENYQVIGGHIRDLEVAGTLEVFLHDWFSSPINRKFDDNTGLSLLDL